MRGQICTVSENTVYKNKEWNHAQRQKSFAPSPKSMIARGSKISLCKLNTQNGTRTRLKSGRVSSTGLNPKLLIAEEAALGSFDDRITASSFGDLLTQCCKTCHFPLQVESHAQNNEFELVVV